MPGAEPTKPNHDLIILRASRTFKPDLRSLSQSWGVSHSSLPIISSDSLRPDEPCYQVTVCRQVSSFVMQTSDSLFSSRSGRQPCIHKACRVFKFHSSETGYRQQTKSILSITPC